MDITTLGAAVAMAKKVIPQVTAADAGKLATVDSNGKWAAADLEVGQGEVAVDTTLLVSGAAADAKVAGDKVNDLKSALSNCENGTGILVEQGYFSNDYKAVDNSFGTYKYKYIASDNTFIMNRDETAGTKKVGISMNDSGLTLAQRLVSIADYPVCRIHVDTNIPQANNPIATVNLYRSDGTTLNHNYTIALATGSADYVVDVAQKIADNNWKNDVYYVIVNYTSDSATYDFAPYIHSTNHGFFTVTQSENYNLALKYANLNTRMTAAEAVTAKAITEIGELNLADSTKFIVGYLDATGVVVTPSATNQEVTTDFIEVASSELYILQCWAAKTGDFWLRYEWFDSLKAFVSRNEIQTVTEVQDVYNYVKASLTVPSGVKYIRISWRSFGNSKVKLEKGDAVTAWTPALGEMINGRVWNGTDDYTIAGIIHRGCGENQTAPENTLPAYIWGAKEGFKFVETDVRYTSDGVPVLLHDSSINRTARNVDGTEISSTVNIASITYEQALEYDFGIYKGEAYAGTKIPTFEQFIKLCKNLNLHPIIELKAFKSAQTDIKNLVAIVNAYGMLGNVSWLAGDYAYLFHVRDNDPHAHLLLLSADNSFDRDLMVLVHLKTSSNKVSMCLISSAYTSDRIAALMSAGITMNAYCPNTEEAMLALDERITFVTSDTLNYETVRRNAILGD